MTSPLFSRSALTLFLACAAALFASSVLLSTLDEDPITADISGPGTYSASAVGYAGIHDLLRQTGHNAERSAGGVLAAVGARGTLVLAEPDFARMNGIGFLQALSAPRILLVLPKWDWTRDKNRPSWVSRVELRQIYWPTNTLSLVAAGNSVPLEVVRADWPDEWPVNELGHSPAGSGTVQLMKVQNMRTIIGSGEGALVGEITEDDKRILIIADPDIMSNHGIVRGENAALMLDIIDSIGLPGAPVVFDETIHGFRGARSSPAKIFFRLPFAIVTILLCCSAALLALAGTGRFGAPQAWTPALGFGREKLIDNSARLLDYGGHHAVILDRYAMMTVRSVARSLHAPGGLDGDALVGWLDRLGRARGVSRSCAEILRNTDIGHGETAGVDKTGKKRRLAGLFRCAGEIYKWKGEILIGSATDRRHR
ncbi:MAG: hypothetical protein LBT31_07160 [Synergistaceae bacterium]|nr:hypothetical protein [Synergistaceae bacterium]